MVGGAARRRPGDYWWVTAAPPLPLTPREQDIVAGVWGGLANKEIAVRLGLAEKTVRNLLTAAYRRLDATHLSDPRTVAAVCLWRACVWQARADDPAAGDMGA
jgi:DNA-binding NarL/FixJ family response regulator